MRRPEILEPDNPWQRPDVDEIRRHARNLLEFSHQLNLFANWVERAKEDTTTYWTQLETHQKNLHDLYKELTD